MKRRLISSGAAGYVLTQWKSAYSASHCSRNASVRRTSSSVDIPVESSIGLPVRGDVLDEREVGQVGRADLVGGQVARLEEVDAARSHGVHIAVIRARSAVREQLAELVVRQLELDQQRDDVLQALFAVARLVEDLLAIGLA